jgi:tRNA (guanine-N7-)-methyltransferase
MMSSFTERPLIMTTARNRGRLTLAQRRAIEAPGGRLMTLPEAPVLWAEYFDRSAPTVCEIGFGDGGLLCDLAQSHADWNFFGIDLYWPGIGAALVKAAHQSLDNVRFMHGDVRVLWPWVPDQSLTRIHVLFSDPWPKKRAHKRRLIQSNQIAAWLAKLVPGGCLYLATDDAGYQDYIEDQLSRLSVQQVAVNTVDFMPNQARRPVTKYERRGLNLGHGVRDWCLVATQ